MVILGGHCIFKFKNTAELTAWQHCNMQSVFKVMEFILKNKCGNVCNLLQCFPKCNNLFNTYIKKEIRDWEISVHFFLKSEQVKMTGNAQQHKMLK